MPDSDAPATDDTLTVTRNDGASRYEIHVGDALGGFCEFEDDEAAGVVLLPHTEVDPAFAGRGLGSELVGRTLADLASRGRPVVPECPFVARWLENHDVPGLEVQAPAGRETGAAED